MFLEEIMPWKFTNLQFPGVLDELKDLFHEGRELDVIFFDVRKAYNTFHYKLDLRIFNQVAVPGSTLKWIGNFLLDGQQWDIAIEFCST